MRVRYRVSWWARLNGQTYFAKRNKACIIIVDLEQPVDVVHEAVDEMQTLLSHEWPSLKHDVGRLEVCLGPDFLSKLRCCAACLSACLHNETSSRIGSKNNLQPGHVAVLLLYHWSMDVLEAH